MSADLTCPTCKGTAWLTRDERLERGSDGLTCPDCHGGRRRPELREWDALEAERDRYRAILAGILECELCRSRGNTSPCGHWDWAFARTALDPEHDLAERTRKIRADE